MLQVDMVGDEIKLIRHLGLCIYIDIHIHVYVCAFVCLVSRSKQLN